MRARDGKLLQKLAVYLNFHADAVTEADVRALADEFFARIGKVSM